MKSLVAAVCLVAVAGPTSAQETSIARPGSVTPPSVVKEVKPV